MRLVRVLDWPLDGLGAGLVAARQSGRAGAYVNLTWPGFAGVVTGIASGRFAIAVNQAPMPRAGLGPWGDWTVERIRVWQTREVPPMHLLRQVFEQCASYAEACHALTHTPIALPAIFTLAGTRAGEGCVIERTATDAHRHAAPVCVANHWLTPALKGRPRGADSAGRLARMRETCRDPVDDGFGWLAPPVLNETTRMAAILDPAAGKLTARGYEADGAATAILALGP
jgi:hypothetical protein